ncbi:MAG TPA: hypothetical protein DD001_10355 [Microcoleaceae bacterium UBA10368]|jgi:hypothetical protein|nr:hypothetical protein [Microcoleaceae cyanobacterium UBA10368]HCV31723.1 hypothetical protein [Microcoleaceae cyanobacterium UBA9251]
MFRKIRGQNPALPGKEELRKLRTLSGVSGDSDGNRAKSQWMIVETNTAMLYRELEMLAIGFTPRRGWGWGMGLREVQR